MHLKMNDWSQYQNSYQSLEMNQNSSKLFVGLHILYCLYNISVFLCISLLINGWKVFDPDCISVKCLSRMWIWFHLYCNIIINSVINMRKITSKNYKNGSGCSTLSHIERSGLILEIKLLDAVKHEISILKTKAIPV